MAGMDSMDDPVAKIFSYTILGVSVVSSILVCIVMLFAVRFVKNRAISRIKYLNSLIMLAEKRLAMQVFPEGILAEVAKKIGGNVGTLQTMRQEREGFENSKKNHRQQIDKFKMPDNAYEDVSFEDPKAKTTYGAPMNEDEIFLHKKPIVSPNVKDKAK